MHGRGVAPKPPSNAMGCRVHATPSACSGSVSPQVRLVQGNGARGPRRARRPVRVRRTPPGGHSPGGPPPASPSAPRVPPPGPAPRPPSTCQGGGARDGDGGPGGVQVGGDVPHDGVHGVYQARHHRVVLEQHRRGWDRGRGTHRCPRRTGAQTRGPSSRPLCGCPCRGRTPSVPRVPWGWAPSSQRPGEEAASESTAAPLLRRGRDPRPLSPPRTLGTCTRSHRGTDAQTRGTDARPSSTLNSPRGLGRCPHWPPPAPPTRRGQSPPSPLRPGDTRGFVLFSVSGVGCVGAAGTPSRLCFLDWPGAPSAHSGSPRQGGAGGCCPQEHRVPLPRRPHPCSQLST